MSLRRPVHWFQCVEGQARARYQEEIPLGLHLGSLAVPHRRVEEWVSPDHRQRNPPIDPADSAHAQMRIIQRRRLRCSGFTGLGTIL